MTGARLLLIEDDPTDVQILRDALHHVGAAVAIDHAHDAASALQVLAGRGHHQSTPTPDAILLDLKLPGLDGEEILHLLQASPEWAGIPVVCLTCVTDPAAHRRCVAAGAVACCLKPDDWTGYVALARELGDSLAQPMQARQRLASLTARHA